MKPIILCPHFSGDFDDLAKNTTQKRERHEPRKPPDDCFFFPLGQVFTTPEIYHLGVPLFTTQSQLGGETSNMFDVRPDLCEKCMPI